METASAISNDPVDQTGYISRAKSALEKGDYHGCHAACLKALEAQREPSEAFYLLAIIASDHDNPAKALELIDRAIRLRSDAARYHAQKARAALMLSDRDLALQACTDAIDLSSTDPHTLDTIGVVLSRAGHHGKAIDFYRGAIAHGAASPDILYNLAAALQFVGDIEEARSVYRKVLVCDPNHHRAWSALVQSERQTWSENFIPELFRAFRAATDPDIRLHLGHAMAKTYEDLGRPDRAMSWLRRAKAEKRQTLLYDPKTDEALFAASASIISRLALCNTQARGDAPIFVVGMPRTGTTLVDRIISSHPRIKSVGELSDFGIHLKREARTPSPFVLDAETLQASHQADLPKLGASYVSGVREAFGTAHRTLDKMPLNFFYAPIILGAIPGARIICVRRNPADTILSNYRQLFATGYSYYNYSLSLDDCAQYYLGFHRLAESYRAELPRTAYTEVTYEQLVSDLETQARRLIGFIGEDWDPACLSFHTNDAPVATASSTQVRRPLYSTSIGRWKRCEQDMREAIDRLDEAGVTFR